MTEEQIIRLYGRRCAEHCDDCCVCEVWAMHDLIETQAREIERLRGALKELVEEYVRNVDCTRLGGFYLDPETEDCIIDARAALAGDSHDQ